MKNIRAERMISILLIIISLFTMIILTNSYLVNAGSGAALQAGKKLYGLGQTCVCSKTHTVVEPKRGADGSISASETVYNYSSSSGTMCTYKAQDGKTVDVGCEIPTPDVVMKKYIDAGVMTVAEATRFYNDSYASALLVQQNLSTKTQTSIFQNGAQTDLGIGRFNRAMFEFNNNAHFVYSFLIGFSFVTALLVFIMIFMKITWLPDHPLQRRNAMENIVTSGVAVILTGGVWIIISLFQSIFDRFWSSYAVYSKDWRTVGNMFLFEYKTIVTGVLGIATLTAMLMLIKNFTQLSFSGDNPSARRQKMISILFCGIAVAGLGGLTIFTGFFWNLIR